MRKLLLRLCLHIVVFLFSLSRSFLIKKLLIFSAYIQKQALVEKNNKVVQNITLEIFFEMSLIAGSY